MRSPALVVSQFKQKNGSYRALIMNQSSAIYLISAIRREINLIQTAIKARVTQTTFAAMRRALLLSVTCCCSYKSFLGEGFTPIDSSVFYNSEFLIGLRWKIWRNMAVAEFLKDYRYPDPVLNRVVRNLLHKFINEVKYI